MNRKLIALLIVLFGISVSRMLGSESIHQLRSVDIVTIFAAGTLFGMVLVGIVDQLRGGSRKLHSQN
ncbi:MAG: hypothetical protein K8J08_12075 [Thermoanaerobaculia bacterium]|nr:hypothetical protein [Thermoanaerobaculia bacterium]